MNLIYYDVLKPVDANGILISTDTACFKVLFLGGPFQYKPLRL